jgi:tetratricopeptide (TPR) repeat protein
MKFRILFFITFFSHVVLYCQPLLVAVLMVKNEEPVMQMTLQPLVDAGIKDFLIYDTGSTDNTIDVTKQFFIENNISNFVIEQAEWVDFATCRNRALDLTEQYFPDATFMLMLDAEWILHNGSDLLAYCKQHENDFEVLYMIQLKGLNIEFGHARLIRCDSGVRFVGRVHEIPAVVPQARIPSHIYFELSPTHFGLEKSRNRWLRDVEILLQELEENPENPRLAILLAQTYFCLDDLPNAIKWYEYRLSLHGDAEEDFLAHFCLAQVYDKAGNETKMIRYYLESFSMRPWRADPLIRLAEHFHLKGAHALCYFFAKCSASMAYPHNEVALVEKYLYDFVRYHLLSVTCDMFQDYTLGYQATLKALEVQPDQEYLQHNLKLYHQAVLQQKNTKNKK